MLRPRVSASNPAQQPVLLPNLEIATPPSPPQLLATDQRHQNCSNHAEHS